MLDIKVESFLAVYRNKSYTKAAKQLCITQPAVTQHIQYLESYYGCKFFQYANRQLKCTQSGEAFYKYIVSAKTNEKLIREKLQEVNEAKKEIKFAATLTIGEFTLPPVLIEFMKTFQEYKITMYVDNTQKVLQMLEKGEIHFAFVEGLFNKINYETRLYKISPYILITSIHHPLAQKKKAFLEDLKGETLVIREKGSGSREILERGLFDKNYTLENFKDIIEIGNVNVMKKIVKAGKGISFMYRDAVIEELRKGEIAEIKIEDFILEREFNFIYLKNSIMEPDLDLFFSFFQEGIKK